MEPLPAGTASAGEPRPASVAVEPTLGPSLLPPALAAQASPAVALAMYREWAKYPPNSRPLTEAQADVLEPLMIAEAPRRLLARDAHGRTRKSDYSCKLQPLRHTITAGETQLITLECTVGQGVEMRRAAIEVLKADLTLASSRQSAAVPLTSDFRDDGSEGDERPGDLVQTLRVQPPAQAWGDFRLAVEVRVPEEASGDKYWLITTFAASGEPPARFTGRRKERIEEGSLVVAVEVEVNKAGRYVIQANLFADEEPVAYANFDAELQSGQRWVDLLFFGKVLKDRGATGPFTMTELRGHRLNTPFSVEDLRKPPAEVKRLLSQIKESSGPEREELVPWREPYVTAAYGASDFSDAEWQSEVKDRRLAELQGR